MQIVVAGFNGDVLESTFIDEFYTASFSGSIKLIDMMVVDKDEEGQVWVAEIVEEAAREHAAQVVQATYAEPGKEV